MRFYKKGTLGLVETRGGASDPEFTEVRMSRKEYNALNDEIRKAKESAAYHSKRASEQIAEARQDAAYRIEDEKQRIQEEADRKVNEAYNLARINAREVSDLRQQLGNEKQLNVNLQRIMRERANQTREITPKKKHDGYLLLRSRQWTEVHPVEKWDTEDHRIRYGGNRRLAIRKGYLTIERKNANAWRSTLQTPYDASIPLDQIQGRVMGEDLWNKGILQELGCHTMCGSGANGKYTPLEEDRDKNVLYRWIFEANYKTGLWELDIFTTKGLTVPEHRRPPRPQKVKGKNKKQSDPKAECMENTSTKLNVPDDGNFFEELGFDDMEDDN